MSAPFPFTTHSVFPEFDVYPEGHTEQISGDELETVQIELDSIEHVELHPSPSAVLPSSQLSPVTVRPSPQILSQDDMSVLTTKPVEQISQVSLDENDPPLQAAPASIKQAELQPSPFAVPPSSHCSEVALTPSPH